jgi:hypothetical protein
MKRSLLLLILIPLAYFSYSQDTAKIMEIGFTTKNLNDFGLTYRFGREKTVWRFNAISTGFDNGTNIENSQNHTWSTLGFGFQFGKEWRTSLTQKFELRYGLDLAYHYDSSKDEYFYISTPEQVDKYTTNNYSTGINAVLGFNFVFTDNFLVGAEFQPAITYTKGKNKIYNSDVLNPIINESESLSFGFNTDAIRLSLLYRF